MDSRKRLRSLFIQQAAPSATYPRAVLTAANRPAPHPSASQVNHAQPREIPTQLPPASWPGTMRHAPAGGPPAAPPGHGAGRVAVPFRGQPQQLDQEQQHPGKPTQSYFQPILRPPGLHHLQQQQQHPAGLRPGPAVGQVEEPAQCPGPNQQAAWPPAPPQHRPAEGAGGMPTAVVDPAAQAGASPPQQPREQQHRPGPQPLWTAPASAPAPPALPAASAQLHPLQAGAVWAPKSTTTRALPPGRPPPFNTVHQPSMPGSPAARATQHLLHQQQQPAAAGQPTTGPGPKLVAPPRPLRLSLAEWGLLPGVVDAYQAKGVKRMYPWQAAALECGEGYNNLIYAAPTSGG